MVANLLASGSAGKFHGEMASVVRNPFMTKFMRTNYASMVECYDKRHKNLISPSGARCIGNALAVAFWRGFDGVAQNWDAASKQMAVYAAWCAGRDINKAITAREVKPIDH